MAHCSRARPRAFARIDLIATGPRLVVSLFAVHRWRSLLGRAPELLGRWSIPPSGELRALPLGVRIRETS